MITGFITDCFGYELTPNVKRKKKVMWRWKYLVMEKINGIREVER